MAFATRPYLASHRLPELFDDIIEKLLRYEPYNPLLFIIGECTNVLQEKRRETAELEGNVNYPKFDDCFSLAAKVLTREIYEAMCSYRTPEGAVVDDLIQLAVDIPEYRFSHSCGCVATDSHCYSVFSELFLPVIQARHPTFDPSALYPATVSSLPRPLSAYAVSQNSDIMLGYFITLERSVSGISFPCKIRRGERRLVNTSVRKALAQAKRLCEVDLGQLRSTFGPDGGEAGGSAAAEDALRRLRHWVAVPPALRGNEYDSKLNMDRDWPDGRSFWLSEPIDGGSGELKYAEPHERSWVAETGAQKPLVVGQKQDGTCAGPPPSVLLALWVNVYEHIQLRCFGTEGDFGVGLKHIVATAADLGGELQKLDLPFASDDSLGWLTSHPANLGAAATAGFALCIPQLSVHKRFDELLDVLVLECCPLGDFVSADYYGLPAGSRKLFAAAGYSHPVVSPTTRFLDSDGVVVLYSDLKMGLSLVDLAAKVRDAVALCAQLEELIQRGQSVDHAIEKLIN